MSTIFWLLGYAAFCFVMWKFITAPVHPPPKKERLLSPAEIAFIEIECGMEPSWTPPPVASLVTRPPDYEQGGIVRMHSGQAQPVNPVYPPKRPAGSKPPTPISVPSSMWTAIPGADLEAWQDTGRVQTWTGPQGWRGLTRQTSNKERS